MVGRGVIAVLAEVAPLEVRIKVGRFLAEPALRRKPPMLRRCSHAEAARAVWPVTGLHALAYGGRITWRVDAGQWRLTRIKQRRDCGPVFFPLAIQILNRAVSFICINNSEK